MSHVHEIYLVIVRCVYIIVNIAGHYYFDTDFVVLHVKVLSYDLNTM